MKLHSLLYNVRGLSTAILFVAITILPTSSMAQSICDMFVSMPDTLMPYEPAQLKTSLLNNARILPTKCAAGKTAYATDIRLSIISPHHLALALDSTATEDLLMLPSMDKDSVCCVIRTVFLPQHDSEVVLYDRNWAPIEIIDFKNCKDFTARPDTMSQARYNELIQQITFIAVEAQVVSDTELKLVPSVPLLFKDDEKAIKAILLQKNVKWDGNIFK